MCCAARRSNRAWLHGDDAEQTTVRVREVLLERRPGRMRAPVGGRLRQPLQDGRMIAAQPGRIVGQCVDERERGDVDEA